MGIYDLAVSWFRKASRLAGFFALHAYFSRPEVRGTGYLDLPGPKVVAANHMGGMLDSALLWTYVGGKVGGRAAFPAKKEFFQPSLTMLGCNNEVFRAWGAIPVDRQHPGNVIDEFVRALERGGRYDGVLSIHFEGRTTPKGVLVGKAKTGFARAALRMPEDRLPLVIPTSVGYKRGTYHALPGFRSHAIVELLEPIDVRPWKERYGRYNPRMGETPGQHAVAEDLAERVKGIIIEDLQRKDIPVAPGFPYGLLG